MKEKLLFLIAFPLFYLAGYSTNLIYLNNGEILDASVVYTNNQTVKFQLVDQKDEGLLYVIDRSEIMVIIREDGSLERNIQLFSTPMGDTTQICRQAIIDANTYYSGSGPLTGSLCCSAGAGPIVGLVFAAISASSPPKDHNLRMPYHENSQEAQYKYCYREEAYLIKKNKVWTGFGIGSAIAIIFAVVYYSNI